MNSFSKYFFILIVLLAEFLPHKNALAQIVPDSTLGQENSKVNSIDELRDRIEGGAIRENNLFHSFQEFNVGEGANVNFANPAGVENIFSRVTGANISNIFGQLGVEGAANLFLLNPNGIIFGENASLNINGSFFATTANSLQFGDGIEFATSQEQEEPILTVEIPIGLSFGGNPGTIQVNGKGHNLILNTADRTFNFPAFSSLSVNSGNTLALIGGDIIFNGGVLTAEDSHIELGSVAGGKVNFALNDLENFRYDVSQLRDITFSNLALADVSGLFGGSINVVGNDISFQSGSGLFVQNSEQAQGNSIKINANSLNILGGVSVPILSFSDRGFIELSPDSQAVKGGILDGVIVPSNQSLKQVLTFFDLSIDEGESVTGFLPSFIFSESLQNGRGNNISVSTGTLFVSEGSQLITRSFDTAISGNIDVNAATTLTVEGASNTPGFAEQSFEIFSQINSSTFGSGAGGNIRLNVDALTTSDGGSINSSSNGVGKGGNVSINATAIDLAGSVPNVFLPSSIAAGTSNEGDAGNLTIDADNILIRDGAAISTATLASGNAGEIKINVTDLIEVRGIDSSGQLPSAITSAGGLLPSEVQQAFRLPPFPTGNAGSLSIFAEKIQVSDGGQINVTNLGTGDAGELQINSNNINLDNAGGITASTVSGQGGNIILNTEGLELLNNSQISASAGGVGNGGNVNINSNTIFSSGNSDIAANAVGGNGGNIQINAKGLFLFPDSTIEASSELGIDGRVRINTLDTNLQKDLEASELNLIIDEDSLANSCLASRNSQQGSFVINNGSGLSTIGESKFYDSGSITGIDNSFNLDEVEQPPKFESQSSSSPIPAQQAVKTESGRIFLVSAPQSVKSLICN